MKWFCDCGCENSDEKEATAVPICAACEKEWFWHEIEDAQRQGRLIA